MARRPNAVARSVRDAFTMSGYASAVRVAARLPEVAVQRSGGPEVQDDDMLRQRGVALRVRGMANHCSRWLEARRRPFVCYPPR